MSNKKSTRIQRDILRLLKESPGVPISRKMISQALGIRKNDYHVFNYSLQNMVREKKITQHKNLQYSLPQKMQRVRGELRLTKSGYGFVEVEGQDLDIFIAQPNLNTALDRDIVDVQLYAASRGKRLEGFISKIITRFRTHIVGTYHKTEFYSFVVPDDPKIYRDIIVREDKNLDAKDGQKVLVKFEKWDRDQHNPEGAITEILGNPDDPGVDVVSVAYSFNLPVSFPDHVEKESENISADLSSVEMDGRLDLRNLTCFTIDPVDAKDFDDAISLENLENGNWELGVHIADVSFYVEQNSIIDKEAFRRGTSVYLVDRVIPMLPEHLSNELCSLKPELDRLTFSCFMEFDPNLEVINYRISPSIIKSNRRFNYVEVQDIINGKLDDPLYGKLKLMHQLSKALTEKRFRDGGIDFETPEVRFVLDEKGQPVEVIPVKRLDSHRLVEEFMLAANQTVAKHIFKISPQKNKLLPFLYRVHEQPNEEKLNKFFEFLNALQVSYKPIKKITSKYIQELLQSIKGTKEELLIEEVALRSMMRAVYSEKNIGHFGLGFKDYTHFTSPIRRYPDLTVHRLLKQYSKSTRQISNNQFDYLKKIAEQATKMERLAMEAERESIKLKQTEYISKHIGEEFRGLVSGVTSFAIFVELETTFIEGTIHIADLIDDFYIYDEKTYSMIGRDTEKVIRMGDEVLVRVESVDLEKRMTHFSLLENYSDTGERSTIYMKEPDTSRRRSKKRRRR
jgi:ribonuclease R